jgi:hypothetical protein
MLAAEGDSARYVCSSLCILISYGAQFSMAWYSTKALEAKIDLVSLASLLFPANLLPA